MAKKTEMEKLIERADKVENDILKNFIKHYAIDQNFNSVNTIKKYSYEIEGFLKYISDLKNINIKDIGYDELINIEFNDFQKFINIQVSSASKSHYKNGLLKFYKYCQTSTNFKIKEFKELKEMISSVDIEKEKIDKQIENINNIDNKDINTDIMNEFIANIEKKKRSKNAIKNLCIVSMMFSLALRCSELIEIRVSDIDFENDTIIIRNKKGNKPFKVELYKELKIIIEHYLNSQCYQEAKNKTKVEEDYLFYTIRANQLDMSNINTIFKTYKMESFTPHSLRKYGATKEYMVTGDIYRAVARLRHSDVKTTTDYYITREADCNMGKYTHMFDGIEIKLLNNENIL